MSIQINNALEIIRNEIAIKRSSLENLDVILFPTNEDSHPKPCSIIAISGRESSGKTSMLSYLLAAVLTPHEFGGKHSRIIFLDLKHKLKPENFLCQIDGHLKRNSFTKHKLSERERNEIALDCLNAIVYIPCFSSNEFSMALDDVQKILMEDDNSEVGLIAIDGLDSFYWLDVYEKKQKFSTHYANLIEKLRSICLAHNVCCMVTVSSKYLEVKGASNLEMANVDYSLHIAKNESTTKRTVNGLPFDITNNGIIFS